MAHGPTVPEGNDLERGLTDEGRAVVDRVAARAAAADVTVDRLYHSGLLRAKQTAEILAARLGVQDRLDVRAGITPRDTVRPFAEWLAEEAASGRYQAIGVVGHVPFSDRLTSWLVAGDEAAQVVGFQTSTLVKLAPKRDRGGYTVIWVLQERLA